MGKPFSFNFTIKIQEILNVHKIQENSLKRSSCGGVSVPCTGEGSVADHPEEPLWWLELSPPDTSPMKAHVGVTCAAGRALVGIRNPY